MEGIVEVEKKEKRVLYWRNSQAEKQLLDELRSQEERTRAGAAAAAVALTNLYKVYKFKNVSEVPANPKDYALKLTIQNNEKYQKLAVDIKPEYLDIKIPEWIKQQADEMEKWNRAKESHLLYLEFVFQGEDEQFKVSQNKIEQHFTKERQKLENIFEGNSNYRKYFSGKDQLARLELCKRWAALLNDSGIKLPEDITNNGRVCNRPLVKYVRHCNGKFVVSVEYILSGDEPGHYTAIHISAADYQLTEEL